ncbi:MAG: argininosuccinate lyase [Synergistaceae bacterium]|nr:argininosuccinate lyase [Synergistaceae bacterium]
MWKGRFRENTAKVVQDFTQSLDIDWFLAPYDIQGSVAHGRMLVTAGLLSPEEGEAIEEALGRIEKEISSGEFTPSEELEDVHMNIEHRLIELLGRVGAKLHTGRSRNDQVALTVRLFLRDRLTRLAEGLDGLLAVLLEKAEEHVQVIIPGYTHLQQAQPISLGHYWMAHFEAFSRDRRRLRFALESLEDCPLGSGALAGSTLPLDRFATASELSFARPSDNSLDSVGQRDYMADYHSFASLFAVHCSRLAEDFVIYSSGEFGWLLLPDGFCTGSSMMPQKKNPDVLELLRGKTGQIVGHFLDLLITLKGLPMTYDRDLQEDKRGLRRSLTTVEGMLEVLVPLLAAVQVDGARAEEGMADGFALATDVAEYLVLRGIPFREAHEKVGRVVKECLAGKKGLFDLSREEWRVLLPEAGDDLLPLLSLRSAVERRTTWGGTAFDRVHEQIARGRALLASAP